MAVKVSIIIPVYNAELTIARAINSVLNQGFDSREVIAVDDGSTDRSFSILQTYGEEIRILRQANRGAAAARNTGAKAAAGEYLAFLDADDAWLPGKLQVCVDAMDASPCAVVAYSDMVDIDGNRLRPISGSPSLDELLSTPRPFALSPSAMVVQRKAFARCEDLSRDFACTGAGFEDTFGALVLREQGEFVHVPEPLVVYYGSPSSVLVSKYQKGYAVFQRVVKRRYGRRGRRIRFVMRQYYSSLWLVAALEEVRKKRFPLALYNLLRATTVSPIYVVNCGFDKIKKFTSGSQRLTSLDLL
jgi:glycosyltransferase involved in cell wall biosynthesis